MSYHRQEVFQVAVLQTPGCPDVRDLMEPYNENRRVEPYVLWTREEGLAKARNAVDEARKRFAAGQMDGLTEDTLSHAKDSDKELIEWFAEEHDLTLDGRGNFLSDFDPKAKWSYYEELVAYGLDEWAEQSVEASEDELYYQWRGLSKQEHYVRLYGDEDTYVEYCSIPDCWEIVTPDGEWHSGDEGYVDDEGQLTWTDGTRDWIRHFRERFVHPYEGQGAMVVILECISHNVAV